MSSTAELYRRGNACCCRTASCYCWRYLFARNVLTRQQLMMGLARTSESLAGWVPDVDQAVEEPGRCIYLLFHVSSWTLGAESAIRILMRVIYLVVFLSRCFCRGAEQTILSRLYLGPN